MTLLADATLNAGTGAISLGGTVDGGHHLTLNSTGTTTLNDAIGHNTALTGLTTNALGTLVMNAHTVTTTGAQSYGEAMTLLSTTTSPWAIACSLTRRAAQRCSRIR